MYVFRVENKTNDQIAYTDENKSLYSFKSLNRCWQYDLLLGILTSRFQTRMSQI